MGVGDTVSNNVSQSIISLLKIVTKRRLAFGCLTRLAYFSVILDIFSITLCVIYGSPRLISGLNVLWHILEND